MTPVRVLVVDDSVVVRRLVSDALGADPGIEVVGTAANGQIALDKLDALAPDLITLDVEMPVMDGIETLRRIRRRDRGIPIVMFSTLTERGASATLDALAAGASDFVTKPANVGSVSLGIQAVREQLIPKVLQLCGRPMPATAPGPATLTRLPHAPARPRTPRTAAVAGVVIGVSTGGPNALAAIWADLAVLPVPILVVQHMPPVFTEMLAKRLDAIGTVPVVEAADGAVVSPGTALLAPGDRHMVLEQHVGALRVRVNGDPPENSCRPSVDPLFRSAAATWGAGTLAVVLTGMGADGLAGALVVRDAGGAVIVQDEASSVVWGMPGAVARAGLEDEQVPLDGVAATLARRVQLHRRPEAARRTVGVA